MTMDTRFNLLPEDAFGLGVKRSGLVRVEIGSVSLTFTPAGQDGGVVLRWRRPEWTADEWIASVAPNLTAMTILAAWNTQGRQMMCGDISVESVDAWEARARQCESDAEPELARAAAALDQHGDAVHSKGSPA